MATLEDKRLRKGKGIIASSLKELGNLAGTALNTGIDLLPWELQIPGGYRYCGPGTRLKERLARGDKPIIGLDDACKTHDISYSQYSDTSHRAQADRELAERAWERFKASDSSLGENTAAWAVTTAMKAKSKLGGSHKRRPKRKTKKKGKRILLKPLQWKRILLDSVQRRRC